MMQLLIPPTLTKKQRQALTTYLTDDRLLGTAGWAQVYQGINLLNHAKVTIQGQTWSFRQLYHQYIDRAFGDLYINQLLVLDDVPSQSPALAAVFVRQIEPFLLDVGLLRQDIPDNWLLLAYCVYWWQSFARGYAFEVEIMRDLEANGIIFEAHDLRRRTRHFGRYSQADLRVLGLNGDIKTSTYFLKFKTDTGAKNDFYITRLYQKGRQRTLVVFQKPIAWQKINGEVIYEAKLEDIRKILPQPVRLQQDNATLIVVEYALWKQKVLTKQQEVEQNAT